MKRNELPQRSLTLPPLNLSRLESASPYNKSEIDTNETETTLYFQRAATIRQPNSKVMFHIIEASQTILFTSSSLQRTVGKCIGCTGNDSLHAAFSPTLHKSRSSTEKLMSILELMERKATTDLCQELIQAASSCIYILKELCWTLRTRLSTLVQGLDSKFSRNLLMNLYSATVDIKEAWEIISPHLSIDPLSAFTSSTQTNRPSPRNRSPSDFNSANSPLMSPLASPSLLGDNTQLYHHLSNAVTGSLHVLTTLRQTIEETTTNSKIHHSLEKKLNELLRQAQNATDLCHRLDKNIESNMGNNKEDLLLLPTRQESSRRIWEDTSIYLKAIVSIMTFIRSISTEEDFVWPKSVKQGCLYVTRMTAEVAKLWNNYSTFAEDGFFLGRQERSVSISDQNNIVLSTSPATDIPMQRRNTQQ
ncbi:RAM signaling pathway protein-domain-containing protein [Thamnidium elegans]|uniref:Uncharacterized protein n=1 Tax=Thamnidium elegans TaxID=101142 RepID=A0A8H7W4C1_9FUNG|nr:hypothetical protein INT48_002611 [Thamnidium elegans]KAI8048232.1 RAM signaling pathway protein-domain-containing protein [Thamnidium elegans]